MKTANDTLTLPVLLRAGEPKLLMARDKPMGDWITYNKDGRMWRLAVRHYRTSDMARYMRSNLGSRSDFQRRLHLAVNLYAKVEQRRHIAEVMKLLLRHFPESKDRGLWLQASVRPLEQVSALLSIGMHGLMPVVWHSQEGGRLALGLLAPSEHQAAFAIATFRLLSRFGWAVCERKACGNVFFLQRKKQKYCSRNCEMADVMRRRRERLKKRAQRRKRA